MVGMLLVYGWYSVCGWYWAVCGLYVVDICGCYVVFMWTVMQSITWLVRGR